MRITEYFKNHILYLDGGMGTLLQKEGLRPGELPERWNITRPEKIIGIHKQYFDAGSNVVNTNTFGANRLKYSESELDEIIKAAIENARLAAKASTGKQKKWVALDIGPSGRMLAPYGDFDFESAVELFAATVRLGVKYGADLIFIETMNDSYEAKAALLAAKENSSLPVFVSAAYGEDGKLMTGASPLAMITMLEGMGADAIGVNCSLGPEALKPVVNEYLRYSSVPVIFKPNAGLPRAVNGITEYDVSAEEFARTVCELTELGVKAIGGCCGTTPEYISALVALTKNTVSKRVTKKDYTAVSSYTHAVVFDKAPVLIGERINPTGKKRLKEALRQNDMSYILNEAVSEEERGVSILDVNVGLPEIDEVKMLTEAVKEIQSVVSLPLQIDTANPAAMESALRRYNGKAMINSVNGKRESMEAVFPLAKKYGGLIVALTLDENGIPTEAEGRFDIAKRILSVAKEYGIDKRDIIFDPLALTVSADKNAAKETLRAVKMITERLHAKTSLGVSNVSFGLPKRDFVNVAFFTMAMENGLSAAIMNPYSPDMMGAYHAFLALKGLDNNCAEYISFSESSFSERTDRQTEQKALHVKTANESEGSLERAIIKGLANDARAVTRELLKEKDALDIVNTQIIPALNTVGTGFESKTVYLPQLLMSAEAAGAAFEVIKEALPKDEKGGKCSIVLATVKGDIHDIGKNIVKLLLENYGFSVTDLGRDVAPEKIADEVVRLKAPLLGLSALMTTTVPAMEDTVKLVRKRSPKTKIIVGGAVLNEDYAEKIGADKYASDAMEGVRYAEQVSSDI